MALLPVPVEVKLLGAALEGLVAFPPDFDMRNMQYAISRDILQTKSEQ